MKNVIGNPARGENFFLRPDEINKIKRRLETGSHLQVTAPRRVGKTSILMYFIDNPLKGYHFIYADTESINSQNDYFRKIYQEILRSDAIGKSKKIAAQLKDSGNKFLKQIKAINVFEGTLELKEATELDYEAELINFLKGIDLHGEKIVLLNDEFPYTIENIINENKGDKAIAINFLKSNRALRQDPEINSKLQIIYTGSIGLNALVENIGKTELINDLASVGVSALSEKDALILIDEVLKQYGYKIEPDAAKYLLEKTEWLIPFHIQLALKEIMDITSAEIAITKNGIDKAFNEIVDYRNNSYFEHYLTRLKKYFPKNEFEFARQLLCMIAADTRVHRNTIHDLAVKYQLEEQYKPILSTLVYDGYINNNENPETFRFNSPVIKIWWNKYVCN